MNDDEVKVGEWYGQIDVLLSKFDDRTSELEEVRAYGQIMSEIDTVIDIGLLQIFQNSLKTEEASEVLDEFFFKGVISGLQIAKSLEEKRIITKTVKEKILRFKSGRNKIIHGKGMAVSLLSDEDEFLEGDDPIKELDQRDLRGHNQYLKQKELGREILKELQSIWKKYSVAMDRDVPKN